MFYTRVWVFIVTVRGARWRSVLSGPSVGSGTPSPLANPRRAAFLPIVEELEACVVAAAVTTLSLYSPVPEGLPPHLPGSILPITTTLTTPP